jgi:hypothetical protein
MYRNARALQRAFEDRQFEVTRTIADCGHFAPAVLAARERLEAHLAQQELLRDAGPWPESGPGRFRQWCGTLAIRLGTWLSGERSPLSTALPATTQPPASAG